MHIIRPHIATIAFILLIGLPILSFIIPIEYLLAIAAILAFTTLFYSHFLYPERFSEALNKPIFGLFSLFIFFHGASAFFQGNLTSSLYGVGIWSTVFIILLSASISITAFNKTWILRAGAIIGAIIVILGLPDYFSGQNYLTSVFYTHNILGGFLILPLFFAFQWFRESRYKFITGTIAIVILLGLLLTFSHGALLCLLLASLFPITQALIHRKWQVIAQTTVIICISTILFILTIHLLQPNIHRLYSTELPESTDIYKDYSVAENFIAPHINYFQTALVIFKAHPWFGVGLENYEDGANLYRSDTKFFTSNPHSIILKGFAEGGLIGGLLLTGILLYLIIYTLRSALYSNTDSSVALALLACLAHALIDMDWSQPLVLFFFVVFAGYIMNDEQPTLGIDVGPEMLRADFAKKVFLFTYATILMAWQVQSAFAFFYYDNATYLREKERFIESLSLYENATRLNPYESRFESEKWLSLMSLPYPFSVADNIKTAEQAERAIKRAIILDQDNYHLWSKLSAYYTVFGNATGTLKTLEKSVSLNPKGAISEVTNLTILYLVRGELDKCIRVADTLLKEYPDSLLENRFWLPRDKEGIKKSITLLGKIKNGCEEIGR